MTAASSRKRTALVSLAVLVASAAGIALFWLTLAKPAQHAAVATPRVDDRPPSVATDQERIAALDTQLTAVDLATPNAELLTSAADIHPHPITPAHQRLRRERAFLAELNQAIDYRDGAALRASLDAYQRDFPEDEQRLQAGYGVIADCLTTPGDVSHASAQSFYDQHHGSSLRRWVRRICLDAEPAEK